MRCVCSGNRVCVTKCSHVCVRLYIDALLIRASAHVSWAKSRSGTPRGDFSCKFAYKIDVNFYKTITATIYVTIMLTKLRAGVPRGNAAAELQLTVFGTYGWGVQPPRSLSLLVIHQRGLIGKDYRLLADREREGERGGGEKEGGSSCRN